MSETGLEKRKQHRHDCTCLLRFAGERFAGYAYTRNISAGGCFAETSDMGRVGMAFEIEIFLDAGISVLPMRATAKVMWCNRESRRFRLGMGLAFVPMDKTAKHYLQLALMHLGSHRPPLPNRALDHHQP